MSGRKRMNLPNRLTVMRVFMIPLFLIFIICPVFGGAGSRVAAAVVFAAAAITDTLDGFIARKYDLITDFGKFLDPLADKMMVISALISLIWLDRDVSPLCELLVIATVIVVFREFAVTSLRLVVSSSEKIVIAAGWLGKIKTTTQMLLVLALLLEPVILPGTYPVISYALMAAATVMTVWSGINYFVAYLPHIDSNK